MQNDQLKTMRDAFIEGVYERMAENNQIFFLSADFGAPALDEIKREFKDRFINVGIAEQNLINVAAGLALEDYIVYAYAIAPFITMRACEQIRQNLSISSQVKPINVNLVGVGTGLSYNLSGPSHHCLEDISIMRLMPNFMVFSPSDWKLAKDFVDYSINIKMPKYLRFDGKPLPLIYEKINDISFDKGFYELSRGEEICLVSTGFMTHRALEVAKTLQNIGVIDVFMLKSFNESALFDALKKYKYVITLEEGFINSGGLDSLVLKTLRDHQFNVKVKNLGFNDKHIFEVGDRDYLHKLNKLDEKNIIKAIYEK
ncbi:MAG: transketolase C-terminal domain-containing protein [Candidatus Azambacteria bacterium]|nr:transketolase C-terminal domain-containing protein [Candidatus Azambacteria bacterium]